ncbi:MAG: hypothetical protein PVG20_10205 [Thioalkalispiraceae bacterium]
MKSIQVFNRYVAPAVIMLIVAVVLSGCHHWHHRHGHHDHHRHAEHGGYHGHLKRGH